ncbi:MAG TPA: hypothetical protein ENI37_04525, partial [Chloroflexi bacterium]|nr:hypothetical protein [Chloroflexota bacterium]
MSPKRVIIEVRKSIRVPPVETMATASLLSRRTASFLLDERFEPLPARRPAHHYALLQMDLQDEDSVLLRGEVEPEEE